MRPEHRQTEESLQPTVEPSMVSRSPEDGARNPSVDSAWHSASSPRPVGRSAWDAWLATTIIGDLTTCQIDYICLFIPAHYGGQVKQLNRLHDCGCHKQRNCWAESRPSTAADEGRGRILPHRPPSSAAVDWIFFGHGYRHHPISLSELPATYIILVLLWYERCYVRWHSSLQLKSLEFSCKRQLFCCLNLSGLLFRIFSCEYILNCNSHRLLI